MTKDEIATLETICAVGDMAVLALEDILGEDQGPYQSMTPERKVELAAGVQFILDHPAAPLAAQHDAWLARNTHRLAPDDPRRVPFDQLPFGQQLKARLWRHITHAVVG